MESTKFIENNLDQMESTCNSSEDTKFQEMANMDLSKSELLGLLLHLEAELEAKEVALDKIKEERSDCNLQKFRYGCFDALQQDGSLMNDDVVKNNMQSIYSKQVMVLDNLVAAQKKAQHRTRIQLAAVEKQYHKVCADLEDEKRTQLIVKKQHEECICELQKEKEQLKEELESEKIKCSKLTEEVEHLQILRSSDIGEINFHKQGAILLMQERKWFADKISKMVSTINDIEISLETECTKSAKLMEDIAQQSSQLKEAEERHIVDLETMNENHQMALQMKNKEIQELIKEMNVLKCRLEDIQSLSATSGPSQLQNKFATSSIDFQKRRLSEENSVKNSSTILSDSGSNLKYSNGFGNDALASIASFGSNSISMNQESQTKDDPSRSLHQYPVLFGSQEKALNGNEHISISNTKTEFQRSGDSSTFDSSSRFDIFGPEMADLQELLVSMASSDDSLQSCDVKTTSNDSMDISIVSSHEISSAVTSSAASIGALTKPFGSLMFSIQAAILDGNHVLLDNLIVNHRPDFMEPLPSGVLCLHYAVECSSEECVRVLLELGADPTVSKEDHITAIHIAASEGHVKCLKYLLRYGHGEAVSLTDKSGNTPLHCAASNGHSDCCQLLLDNGARLDARTNKNWTPMHSCINSGHSHCLDMFLNYWKSHLNTSHDHMSEYSFSDAVNSFDKDGLTMTHLAAICKTKECLEILSKHVHLNSELSDKWNRTVMEIASSACRSFLQGTESLSEMTCAVSIELAQTGSSVDSRSSPRKQQSPAIEQQSSISIGSVFVSKTMKWSELEEKLNAVFLNHASEVSIGLRTKKICRFDQDSPDAPNPFTLGISLASIKYFSIGRYHWSPGTTTEKHPFEMLSGFNTTNIGVKLFGLENDRQDSLAYDSLIPAFVLQNYLRLMEQYKSVVFYGPKGMGKTYLVRKLAACIQMRESNSGIQSEVTFFNLSSSFTRKDLLKLLLDKGCLIQSSVSIPPATAPILILDDLAKISVVDVFKDVLPAMETRGPSNSIAVKQEGSSEVLYCYMHPNCFIVGTMDRSRSTGLELSIQQRFKWVQLRCDQEPSKYLLHRHLLRRLADSHRGIIPLPDNSVYKAVEWVICVWQRLNDGLAKLGLLDLVFGPCIFLLCPVEVNKPKVILRWLSLQWNRVIAPAISEAVIKGSGNSEIGNSGQQKVASTALYVIMQRSIVSGCPLAGLEKERYFASFQGSNELDIKIRGERKDVKPPGASSSSRDASLSRSFKSSYMDRNLSNSDTIRKAVPRNVGEDQSNLRKYLLTSGIENSPTSQKYNENTGTSMFAVSGIPSTDFTSSSSPSNWPEIRSSPTRATNDTQASIERVNLRPHTPVIVTQPVKTESPLTERRNTEPALGSNSKKSMYTGTEMRHASQFDHLQINTQMTAANQWYNRSVSPVQDLLKPKDFDKSFDRSASPGVEMFKS